MRLALPVVFVGTLIAACSSSGKVTSNAGTTSAASSSSSSSGHGGSRSSSASTTGSSSSGLGGMSSDAGPQDASFDVPILPPPDGSIMNPCQLPGSIQFTTTGKHVVSGGDPSWPDLSFLTLPQGFCAHYFGTVGNARQIRFAPGGELFVASPTQGSTGGGLGGRSAIVTLPDYNLDGVADSVTTFLSFASGGMNQGMLFANGFFYYQDGVTGTQILRLPYTPGQLTAPGPGEMVANITYSMNGLHWPKTMDIADDGTIYVGNGGGQTDACMSPRPFMGGIRKIDPAPGGPNPGSAPVAQGFRNPIAIRCARGHNQCFALELALDYSAGGGGREKMVPIRQGDDWGFPCCATQNIPYGGTPVGTDCSTVAADTNSFLIGDTPFGVDFEGGYWPGQWNRNAFVVTHGAAGGWTGARMVAIPMDPNTGLPTPSTNINGTNMGMTDFATGWDDGSTSHGRPAAVAFAPDGRLFVAQDNGPVSNDPSTSRLGIIFWISPM